MRPNYFQMGPEEWRFWARDILGWKTGKTLIDAYFNTLDYYKCINSSVLEKFWVEVCCIKKRPERTEQIFLESEFHLSVFTGRVRKNRIDNGEDESE